MALVLLHGFTGSPVSFRPVIARLRPGPVVAPVLPGHDGVAPTTHLDDTLAAIREQVGPGPHHLAGYSLGGRLALHFALRFPEDVTGLTVFGARPGLQEPKDRAARLEQDRQLASVLRREGLERFLEHWEAVPLLRPRTPNADRIAESRAIRRRHDPFALATALETLSVAILPNLWPRLGELSPSVRWVFGEHDPVYRQLMTQAAEITGDLRNLEGAGHAVLVDQPEGVAKILNEVLEIG